MNYLYLSSIISSKNIYELLSECLHLNLVIDFTVWATMPRIIHPLSKEDDQRIKRNWMFLKTNLDQHAIRGIFFVEDIWDLCDFARIDAEKTPEKKNEMFLKLLLQSGTRAYKVFIAALEDNNSTYIVEQLQQTPITEAPLEPSGRHYCKNIL